MHLSIGDTIERYQVERLLGQGGMAAVFQVRHTTLGTRHALKVLTITRRSVSERLVQEGVLQAQLRHPHIVAVTDVLEIDGSPGLLMEFIDGGSLHDLLVQGPVPLEQAEQLFRGVLDAVEYAHEQGVIHRDLKPANVMLATSPAGLVPKVADFGLAKLLAEEEPVGRKATRSGIAMGTPSYMAPEQIRSAKHVDHRADVFALGCILYELVSGREAFPGEDMLDIFNQVVSGSFAPVSSLDGEVPTRIDLAIRGALQVDPERRTQTAADLRRILDGEAFPEAPAVPLGSAGQTYIEGVATPLAAATTPLPADTLDHTLDPATLPDPPPPPPDGGPRWPLRLFLGLVFAATALAGIVWSQRAPEPEPVIVAEPTPARTPTPAPKPVNVGKPRNSAPVAEPTPEPTPTPRPAKKPKPFRPKPTPATTPSRARPRPGFAPMPEQPPSPQPVSTEDVRVVDVPKACAATLRCLRALQSDDGPVGKIYGGSLDGAIEGIELWIRLGDMGGSFDANTQCQQMLDSYVESLTAVRSSQPELAKAVPAACR